MERVMIRDLSLGLASLCFLFIVGVACPGEATWRDGGQRFSFSPGGEPATLPITFDSKKYQFLLDTGATNTVFDQSLLLGEPWEPVEVRSAAGTTTLRSYERPKAL